MKGALPAALMLFLALAPLAATASAQSPPSHAPAALLLTVLPAQLPADGRTYPALVVSLVDAGGGPTISLSDVTVYLSTTNATVASVPQGVTIPAGHSFVQVGVTTSTRPGSVTLGATSQGLASSQAPLTTVVASSGPASLALSLAPRNTVQPLLGAEAAFAVELKDAAGGPAVAPESTSVVITSSNGTVIPGAIAVTIPAGSGVAYGTIQAGEWGSATLTALSTNLGTGAAQLDVIPSRESVTLALSPSTVPEGVNASVSVSVQVLWMPIQGDEVALTSPLGVFSPAFGATNAQGEFDSVFIPLGEGAALVNATAYSPLTGTLSTTATLMVTGPSATTTTSTSGASTVPPLLVGLVPVVVAAVVVVVGFLLVRSTLRRRRGTVDEEVPAEEPKA